MAADVILFVSIRNAGNPLRYQRGDVVSVHDVSERESGPLGYGLAVNLPDFARLEISNVGKGQLRRVIDSARLAFSMDARGEAIATLIRKRQVALDMDGTLPADVRNGLDSFGTSAMRKQEAAPHFIDKDTGLPVLS